MLERQLFGWLSHNTPNKRRISMFYVKAHGGKISIESDNVFTYCPGCGKKHYVDVAEILNEGGDLYGSAVYCRSCSKKLIESRNAARQSEA